MVNILLGVASRLNSGDVRRLREEAIPGNSFQGPSWGKCWGLYQTGTAQEAPWGRGSEEAPAPYWEESVHPLAFLTSPGFTAGHPGCTSVS